MAVQFINYYTYRGIGMTHDDLLGALHALGYPGGWVVTGTEITVWENSDPKPTDNDIKTGLKLVAKGATDKAEAKQALLDRLGITADEAALLLG